MKKFLPGLICLAGTACLYCCSSEYDIFENDVEQISDQFSVAEARAYFERTAEDLRGVTIGAGHTHAPVTKALPGADEVEGGPVLTPQWSKGRQTDDNGLAVSIEIPLAVQGTPLQAAVSEKRNGRKPSSYLSTGLSKLILKKNVETGETFYFIATFIPDSACFAKRKQDIKNYRYMKDADYSGLVILSDERGEYLGAILRKDGKQQRVKLRRCIPESEKPQDVTDNVLMRLNLSQKAPIALLAGTNDSEERNDDEIKDGICLGCGQPLNGFDYCQNPNCGGVEVVGPPLQPRPDPIWPGLCTNPNCPYGGHCNGLCDHAGIGGGGDNGGGTTGGGGEIGNDNSESVFVLIPRAKMLDAVNKAVQQIIKSFPGKTAACSNGVQTIFKNLFGSNALDGKRANDMVKYWEETSASWKQITMSSAQRLANDGYFVVAGRFESRPGHSGHVVVVVPGEEKPGWGGLVPVVMDTGYGMRSVQQKLSSSWRKEAKDEIQFYYYKNKK